MKIILVADIFGLTPALDDLRASLVNELDNVDKGGAVNIVDPYNGEFIPFKNENSAYRYFTEHVGLTAFSHLLQAHLTTQLEQLIHSETFVTKAPLVQLPKQQPSQILLIGFSIGASAIWHIADRFSDAKNQIIAIGYYGSQIRNKLNNTPNFPIHLIFPKQEPHFSVDQLMKKLSRIPRVRLTKVDYAHGFMNKLSSNYNQAGYLEQIKEIRREIFAVR